MAAIDMPLKANQQIDEGMNINDWKRLKDLLNSNGKWRQLGVAMEIADAELDRIATRGISMSVAIILLVPTKAFYIFLISENPAEALIQDCCRRQRNHTISDVHRLLTNIQFEDGVILLTKYVKKTDDNEVEME